MPFPPVGKGTLRPPAKRANRFFQQEGAIPYMALAPATAGVWPAGGEGKPVGGSRERLDYCGTPLADPPHKPH